MNLKFSGDIHSERFADIMLRMGQFDCYYKSLAYLLTFDDICYNHINEIFDFKRGCIIPDCLVKPWVTGTSKRTLILAFNLFTSGTGFLQDNSFECTPDNIFGYGSGYEPYYWQAIKIRYNIQSFAY